MGTVAVTDLVLNFAEACRALVPSLDRAGVPWRDGVQYDNWDRIAEPLFESLVTEPCGFAAVGEAGLGQLRVARYGFAPAGDENAWIAVDGARLTPVVGLSSIAGPFDHVQCAGTSNLVPLNGAHFIFVYEASDGSQQRLEVVNLTAE